MLVAKPRKTDPLAVMVRALFGRYVSDQKIEALRRELTRAGFIPRDEEQTPYDAGPPISRLH
jgi:hypothetical protein